MTTELHDLYENGMSSCCGAKVYMGSICSDCKEHCGIDEELPEESPLMPQELGKKLKK